MNNIRHKIAVAAGVAAVSILAFVASAQEQKKSNVSPEQEKKMTEFIQTQVERLTDNLNLETWQTFYVDSIMNHDMRALQEELADLSSAKVSNTEIYVKVNDKWNEKIYNSMKAVLNETQWARYLKMGAGKDKKMRDKRAAKAAAK
ncbi:MAG: hypothetical protein MJY84_01425 [Bacteroidales bacterium]|nr:hypothetical protein [Bacteroidales bacterium]